MIGILKLHSVFVVAGFIILAILISSLYRQLAYKLSIESEGFEKKQGSENHEDFESDQ